MSNARKKRIQANIDRRLSKVSELMSVRMQSHKAGWLERIRSAIQAFIRKVFHAKI